MPDPETKRLLDDNRVKYVAIDHSPAFTAQEIAASAHIPGRELAKTVMVKLDGKMAMVVMPASSKVDFEPLKTASGAEEVVLASETEFATLFPESAPGAMSPFGNLHGMEVFASDILAQDEEIAFNAGSHNELVRVAFADFARLAKPQMAHLSD